MDRSSPSSALAAAVRQLAPLAPRPAPIEVPTTRGTGVRMRKLHRMPHSRRFMGAANLNNTRGGVGPAKQIVRPLQMKKVTLKPQGEFDMGDLAEKQALLNISTTQRHHEPKTTRRLPVMFGETKRGDIRDAAVEAFGGANNLRKVPGRPQQTVDLNSSVLDPHSSLIPNKPDRPLPDLITHALTPGAQAAATPQEAGIKSHMFVAELPTTTVSAALGTAHEEPALQWSGAGVEGAPQSLVALRRAANAANPAEIMLRTEATLVNSGAPKAVALPLAQQSIWAPLSEDVRIVEPRPTEGLVMPLHHKGRAAVTSHQTFAGVEGTALPAKVLAPRPGSNAAAVGVREFHMLREAGAAGVVPFGGAHGVEHPVAGQQTLMVRGGDPLASHTQALRIDSAEPALISTAITFAGVEFTRGEAPPLAVSGGGATLEPELSTSMTFHPMRDLAANRAGEVAELGTAVRHDVLSHNDPMLGTFRPPQSDVHGSELDVAVRNPVRVQYERPAQPSWSPWNASSLSHMMHTSSAAGVAGGRMSLGDRAVPVSTPLGGGERARLGAAVAAARAQRPLDLSPDVNPQSPRRPPSRRGGTRPSLPMFHRAASRMDTSNHPHSPKRIRALSAAHRRLRA